MKFNSSWGLVVIAVASAGCSSNSPTSTGNSALPVVPTRATARPTQTAAQKVVDALTGGAGKNRDQARDLWTQSIELQQKGDNNGAMDKRVEILRLRHTKTSSLGVLSYYATQQLALDHLARIASHLDAASSQKYADKFKAVDAEIPTFPQILEAAKQDNIREFNLYIKKPGGWQQLIQALPFTKTEKAQLAKLSPAQIRANITKLYDGRIAAAKQPYGTPLTDAPVDPYTKFVSKYDGDMARFLWTKNKTLRTFAIVALNRKTDHTLGRERIGPLPADPFGTGPLKEASGNVYSVGPDTVDNGGAMSYDADTFQMNTKGDMIMPLFSPRAHLAHPIP